MNELSDLSSLGAGMAIGVMVITYIICFVAGLVMIIAQWRLYDKAGKPGWAVLIPFYGIIVWLDIIKRPTWWLLLLFVPGVNVVISVIMATDLAACFGKSKLWGFVMLVLFSVIGYCVLAFGNNRYVEPQAAV